MTINQKMVCTNWKLALTLYLVSYTSYLIVTESDGSNDSGTSSFGSDNKNNPESRLLNIPFIEVIKVK